MKCYMMMRRNGDAYAYRVLSGDSLVEPLPLRLDLANHSPDGFEWGYAGSGPAQLALAILADIFDDQTALKYYQQFKSEVIAVQDRAEDWNVRETDVRRWIKRKECENAKAI